MKIYCMSSSKSKIAAQLEQSTRQIIIHLIKLYCYPDNEAVKHWRREVANQLNSVDRQKSNNKYPKADFIYDNTFKIHSKQFSYYVECILEDYGYSTYTIDETILKHKIQSYFYWLSKMLSKHGLVSYNSIYEWLEANGF